MSPELSGPDLFDNPLWQAVPDGLVLVDGRGTILGANRRLTDMLGYPPDALVGESLAVLVPPEVRAHHGDLVDGYLEEPAPRTMAAGGRLAALRADGSELNVMISLAPIVLDGIPMVIAAVRDVSESVMVEQRLAEATRRRMMMEFRDRLGRDLHDTVIQELFALGMSLQAVLPVAPEGLVSERIAGAVDKLDATIREIRDAVLGPRADHRIDTLSARIVAVVADLTPALGFAPRVSVDPRVDAVVPPVVVDHMLPTLREALANVARHAEAVDVDVEVAIDDDHLELRVRDDGVGLPQRLERASGLANLRQRAEELGGSFEIGSGPEAGSLLVWRVPIAP